MTNSVLETQRLGQSIWYDNIRRGLITSGELQNLIEVGVTGVTSNPTIFEKAIAGSTDYDDSLIELAHARKSTTETFEALAIEDIRAAADLLRPIYERTNGVDGYISLEVSPSLAHDTEGTIAEAKRLFSSLERPNVMIKVPATSEGIPAIRSLIGWGMNINVTLIFSLEAYRQVMNAYISGLEDLHRSGKDISKIASVASFFVSRVDTAVDRQLEEKIGKGSTKLRRLLGKAAIANAKIAYQYFNETFNDVRFAALKADGARVQRPLWASTGTKNPAYSDVLYIESLIGSNTINTTPPATLTAFLEHGVARPTLEKGVSDAKEVIKEIEAAGISLKEVTAKLLVDGVKSFADSFDKLMANIEEKRSRLIAKEYTCPGAGLGSHLAEVETTIADIRQKKVIERIWSRDHTVWNPDPAEITNRLGWLTVTDQMNEQVEALESFANDIIDAGFQHAVLLGMGGSSLGPEVLRQTFGSTPGHLELIVLGSTVPGWVHSVSDTIDPAKTLFLVSSKSGGTIEPISFYKYFRRLVEKTVGQDKAGQHFVAITDPGTSLEKLASEHKFRRAFLNPPDIGGRYSVLSYFGLVPATLIGVDLAVLLDRADCVREGCASCVPAHDNPGAWFGAIMGTLAKAKRDKLTLVTSPSIAAFGLWAEQLIAESTGKYGKGIIPVAGEPLLSAESYGDDRLFIYMRLNEDDNAKTDKAIESLKSSGQPVVQLDLRDKLDLGAEFFRWEFATTVAGAVIGIHPFDQPNVQQAKDITSRLLNEYQESGHLPEVQAPSSFESLLDKTPKGSYLAIMAYLHQSSEIDCALADLRKKVMERHKIATTLGYGPRFLHSTGQLHKGGPATGLFLQITADNKRDVGIPGEHYTFGALTETQALGDLQALQRLGRSVARVHLKDASGTEIIKLTKTFK